MISFGMFRGGVWSGPVVLELADAQNLGDDIRRPGQLALLEFRAVNGRCIQSADSEDGSVEVIEAFLLNEAGDLGSNAAEGFVFFHDHGTMRFAHGVEDGFLVERSDGAKVEDLRFDIMFG
jgi:hypothetical protein